MFLNSESEVRTFISCDDFAPERVIEKRCDRLRIDIPNYELFLHLEDSRQKQLFTLAKALTISIIVHNVTNYALNDRLNRMAPELEYNFIMFKRLRSWIRFPDVCL